MLTSLVTLDGTTRRWISGQNAGRCCPSKNNPRTLVRGVSPARRAATEANASARTLSPKSIKECGSTFRRWNRVLMKRGRMVPPESNRPSHSKRIEKYSQCMKNGSRLQCQDVGESLSQGANNSSSSSDVAGRQQALTTEEAQKQTRSRTIYRQLPPRCSDI